MEILCFSIDHDDRYSIVLNDQKFVPGEVIDLLNLFSMYISICLSTNIYQSIFDQFSISIIM